LSQHEIPPAVAGRIHAGWHTEIPGSHIWFIRTHLDHYYTGRSKQRLFLHANLTRHWLIYADFAQILMEKARKLYVTDSFGIELDAV